MFRRWFIRIIFMLPILFCMGVSVLGATRSLLISKLVYTHNGHFVEFAVWGGYVCPGLGWGVHRPNGWNAEIVPQQQARALLPKNGNFLYFLGFGLGHHVYPWETWYGFAVPCWFLLLVSSTALFFVWRKTRPKSNLATAFPVEVRKTPNFPGS